MPPFQSRSEAEGALTQTSFAVLKARAKASPSELRARLVVSPKPREARADQERLRRPSGAFATWQAAGEEHPQPPARSVGVVPGRQGLLLRGRCASLDPHPLRQCPPGPCAASGVFRVKGGSRGWCGPQPRRARTRPLDATGATPSLPAGCRGRSSRHPCPRREAPAGRRRRL